MVIRVHYSPDTWEHLDPLIDDLNDTFAEDERFTIYFKSVERLGGGNDDHIRLFTTAENAEVKRLLESRLSRPEQALDLDGDGPYICYASKPNSLIIRASGEIAKCTVALYDKRNRVGTLNPDGSLDVDQARVRHWIAGFATLDEEELGCPYSAMNQRDKPKETRASSQGNTTFISLVDVPLPVRRHARELAAEESTAAESRLGDELAR